MAAQEKDAAKKGGGLIIALAVLTLIAGAGGGGLGYMLAGTVKEVVTAKAKAEPPPNEEPPLAYSGDLSLKELKPVVVNLAGSSSFARIEAALIFKNGTLPNPDVTAAEIREDMMAYMRTLSLAQLDGPSALQHLREDLNERAGTRSDGKVIELVLQSLVVQ